MAIASSAAIIRDVDTGEAVILTTQRADVRGERRARRR
jgi:hypothetical protein